MVYGAPLFIFAVFLAAQKAQFQGIIVMLSVLWVQTNEQLALVFMFSVITVLYGRIRAASETT